MQNNNMEGVLGKGERRFKINLPARASFFFTLGGVALRVGGLIFTPFFTRLLSTEDYGAYSVFNSTTAFFTFFSTLQICGAVLWRGLQRFKSRRGAFLYDALILLLLLWGISAPLFLLFSTSEPFPYSSLLICALSLGNVIINLLLTYSKFLYKYKLPLLISLLQGFALPALALGALMIFNSSQPTLVRAVTITVGTLLLSALPFFYIILRYRRENVDIEARVGERREHLGFLLRMAIPTLPYQAALIFIGNFDKLYINNTLGTSSAGVYTLAHSLGLSAAFIATGATQALSPWIMRKIAASDLDTAALATDAAISALAPTTVFIGAILPEALAILAPTSYGSALYSAYPFCLSTLPIFISSLASCALMSRERSLPLIICGTSSALLNLSLNLLLTARIGIFWAAVTSLISHLLPALLGALFCKRMLGKHLFNVNKALLLFMITVVLSELLLIFEGNFILRAAIGILALGVAVFSICKNRRLFMEGEGEIILNDGKTTQAP